MKKVISMAMMALLAATLMSCAQTDTKGTASPQAAPAKEEKTSTLDVKRSNVSTTVATVESVDLTNRIVKLRSLEGKPFTVRVGKEAVNLPQVKAGDKVEITYAQVLEVRMAEPGEVRDDVGTIVGRAKPGAKPQGVGITETNITATILEIDKASEAAKLKFADGSIAVVKVQNPANLDKVKVGDTIAIKYIEALEIKVQGKKK
jgi:Cu/Ag efflux protein CusF